MPAEAFAPPPSPFGALLVHWNGLEAAGFVAWDFLPGMRFGDREAWWRPGADRDFPHEGLDVGWYRTAGGARRPLGAGARVPAPWPGEVVALVPDFLGVSVFVAHAHRDRAGGRLHSVCGHLAPRPGLAPGVALGDGDEIGTVAAPSAGRRVPPHLHLTLALLAAGTDRATLGWQALRDRSRALLLDPRPLLGQPARWSRRKQPSPADSATMRPRARCADPNRSEGDNGP